MGFSTAGAIHSKMRNVSRQHFQLFYRRKLTQLQFLLMHLCIPLVLLVFCQTSSAADYQQHWIEGDTLVINTDESQVMLRVYGGSAIEVLYRMKNTIQLPSFAIKEAAETSPLDVANNADFLSVNGGKISAVVSKFPLQISFYQAGQLLVTEEVGFYHNERSQGFRFKLQDNEKLIGGGERVMGMDRRGQRFPLYNKPHYGYSTQSHQMYFGLPAVMSSQHYTLIFDNSALGTMDLGQTQTNIMQFDAVAGRTAYIVVAGHTYPELIENTAEVTGLQPLPPMWLLGNFASRFGYHSEQETRNVVKQFIDEGFPLDAVMLDLYWFGNETKGKMGDFDWDPSTFPTPKKMLSDFQALGVKTILITQPYILSDSKRWPEAVENSVLALGPDKKPKQFDILLGKTGLIDVFNEQASQWFSDLYTSLYKQGVAGWWGDLGELEVHPSDTQHRYNGMTLTADEIHNVYGHTWAKRVFENQLKIAPQERPFVMMRSGFIGSQRYGMIPWTGDVSRSWGGLSSQVELSLQMGLLGLAYTHSDLGGYAEGEKFDQELYLRWLEYGVFQPVFRPHGQENIPPEPIFHDKETKDIARGQIKLRYAMLPYNYSLVYENSLTGLPLMRPVFFEDEQKPELMDIKDSYFWGEALLVKPITEPGLSEVTLYLPAGRWFDFWTDEDYDGNQSIALKTDLDRIPVMVRAGSFLPMVLPVKSTDDYSTRHLDLHYYSDSSITHSQGKMYNDEGLNPKAITLGQYETLSFSATQQEDQLAISLNRQGNYKNMPRKREMRLIIHNWLKTPGQAQKVIEKLLPEIGTVEPSDDSATLNAGATELSVEASVSSTGANAETQANDTVTKPAPVVILATNKANPAPMLASLPLVTDLENLEKSKSAMYWEESTSTLYLKFSWQHDIQLSIKQQNTATVESK